jgi:hypothetical protein
MANTRVHLGTEFDPARMTEDQLLEAIRTLEDLKAQAAASQAALTRELDARVQARHQHQRVPPAQRGRDVAGLVAFARRESPARGSRFLGFAHALAELPYAEAAMRTGALSEWRAMRLARETACLSRPDRAEVDRRIAAPRADGPHRFDGWGDRRLVAEVRAVVAEVDPAALVERHSRAEADRRVSLRPAPDTMAQLSTLLPAAQGVAVWATLSREADQARAAGDPRTRGQIMADTLVERVTGQTRADAVPVTVNLVLSDQALTGGHQPAWLHEYGAISAETADQLTRRAMAGAHAALRRLYAAPTGALVAMESTAREFPKGLATFLDLRDRTCRTPWCDAPIRHHDHIADHAAGGSTSAVNGQGLCEQCNHTKQAPGWRARPIAGPPGLPHTVETTLPTGHRMTSTAPPAPTPCPLRPVSSAELHLSRVVLEYAA